MKRTLTLILSLISLIAGAQEPQIIGGYLLDGQDSFEELEAAVLTEGRTKDKKLTGKGMRMPGFVWFIPTDIRIYRIMEDDSLKNILQTAVKTECTSLYICRAATNAKARSLPFQNADTT